MSKIKVLSPQEICKIAAGEVVERPANIVKELVENALDAGASLIEIYLIGSGKQAIRVVDNGCGMSAEDARLCFEHHATSKIKTVADLENIASFGFRGEALSSIAAVSKITMVTTTKEAVCGTKTILDGGKITSQTEVASTVGTDLLITELFFNVPARQKFLKKDETEWRQVIQLFYAFVFDYTGVHFKLYSEERLVHNCPPVTLLKERLLQLWDVQTAENILAFNTDAKADIKISGVISNHQLFRYNRANIFCFVNRRLVKNYSLVKAILKGYANVLPEGRYPIAVILIDLPNTQVDINVHPRKEEVNFLHPQRVESLITIAIKNELEAKLASYVASPQLFNRQNSVGAINKFKGAQFANFDFEAIDVPTGFFTSNVNYEKRFDDNISNLQQEDLLAIEPLQIQATFVERNYEVIGQFKSTYILVSNTEGLLLVDQHAAHERILYEQFRQRFAAVVTVNLVFPVIITLSEQDLAILKPHIEILREHGIGADIFGKDQIIIQATPTYLKHVNLEELVRQLVAWICEYQALDIAQFTKKINEQLHAQMACKAAVKAGDILSIEQMYELLDDLNKIENRVTCPHGRPTTWYQSLSEIERKFKRKY